MNASTEEFRRWKKVEKNLTFGDLTMARIKLRFVTHGWWSEGEKVNKRSKKTLIYAALWEEGRRGEEV